MTDRVGFIGIGTMGSAIARNIRKAGMAVAFVIHDERDRANAVTLTEDGAEQADGYESLVADSDVIMLSLPDSTTVESVVMGEHGIGTHLQSGQVVVDLSTSYPPSTRAIAAVLEARGVAFMDAPLSGSRPQAEAGTLTVICGGRRTAFERIRPILATFSAEAVHIGDVGSGHAVKLINNFLSLLNLAAICEMLPFAQKYGLCLQELYSTLSKSGANSVMLERMMPRLLKRDFSVTFKQAFAHKDLRYFNDLTREEGVPTPLAASLLSVYDMAAAKGYGERDMTSQLQFWEEMSGVTVEEAPGDS